jgi:Raf kinase inhibitor-like YbhB/YbcL family protein
MKTIPFTLFLSTLALVGTAFGAGPTSTRMTLSSTAMPDGSRVASPQVFDGFGCTGGNISPDLKWSGAPRGTKSFAVTLYDPDAPTGSGWWHWVVFNIPPAVTELRAGSGDPKKDLLPKGAVQARTDFGKVGYGGPCPPKGSPAHRYVLTVYALKDVLPLEKDASGAMVGFYLSQLKLGEAKLEAKYGR